MVSFSVDECFSNVDIILRERETIQELLVALPRRRGLALGNVGPSNKVTKAMFVGDYRRLCRKGGRPGPWGGGRQIASLRPAIVKGSNMTSRLNPRFSNATATGVVSSS